MSSVKGVSIMARVVIAGGGYGGVRAGKRLERAEQAFTIVNKHS